MTTPVSTSLAEEVTGVVGGVVAQPIFNGQPVFRSAIVAQAAEGTRLSAVLAKFPGYSLFPMPLDATNIVSPDVEAFLPGDLLDVTVVISSRPQQMATPTVMPEVILQSGDSLEPTATPAPQEVAQAQAISRALPPLAKDLFPMGVRVISVQGSAARDRHFQHQRYFLFILRYCSGAHVDPAGSECQPRSAFACASTGRPSGGFLDGARR